MASTATEKKKHTYEDYLKTPDDVRYELIQGDLLMTPSPVTKHQRILRKIGFMLEQHVTQNDLGEIFLAPYDVYFDDENVVQPDILFISRERLNLIGEKNMQGPPDLVIEILSESTAYRDLIQKKKLYARYCVKEYWIVIPEEESVGIYIIKNDIFTLHKNFGKDETLESPLLKGLKIVLRKIF